MNKFTARAEATARKARRISANFIFFEGDCLTCRRTSVNYWAEAPAL